PFQGRHVAGVVEQVKRGEFPPPRRVKPGADRALEAVCLKAMARRPDDRDASALDLAADVERWLADEPGSGHREPLAVRLGRGARRHRSAVAGVAAVLVTAVTVLALATALISRQKAETDRQRSRAEANFGKARDAVDRMLTRVAEQELANV